MKPRRGQSRMVIVTCANAAEARRVAQSVVEQRLAACANILSAPVQSIYRWKGRVERAAEVIMLLKTTAKHLGQLENEVKRLHSYDVPEFIALPIVAGSNDYLKWIADSVNARHSVLGRRAAPKSA
jgi:periplasmic divalent cation tolerance protein